ncbi:MAG: metal ABC transporter ATP-binding protein [Candidatus Amulumruptor caecigallinarius]|nr:metal ABC transporter ATP-binding protein [Candidatus Amulumruptor caecigallinarius]
MNNQLDDTLTASRPADIIRLSDVDFAYDRHRQVLEDVNLCIRRGETLLVEGPNGGGKTTLLRLLLGLSKPTHGSVAYFGQDGQPVRRLHMGYLPQKSAVDSHFPITVSEVVEGALLVRHSGHDRSAVADALARVELGHYANKPLGNLSGGQVQRALLARAIVSHPEVLVLDEPLSYLDEPNRLMVRDIVASLRGKATIIIVTHEPELFTPLATRRLYVNTRVTDNTCAGING